MTRIDSDEAAAEAQRDAELRAVEVRIKAAAEPERVKAAAIEAAGVGGNGDGGALQ
jgi:hypothetical protein